jgi:cytochrome P450
MSTARDIESCPLHEVDTFDPEFLQDPHPYYRRLRAEAPVFRDPKNGIVYVSSYELVMEALARPLVFSNRFGAQLRAGAVTGDVSEEEMAAAAEGYQPADTMLTADPPEHTKYKKLAGRAFTYKKVMAMNDYVETIVTELLDAFAAQGRCEFKSQFANLLPMYVICDALGFPREDRDRFRQWSDAFTLQLSGMANAEQRVWCARKIVEAQHYFLDICEQRRREPREDICSDLVQELLEEEDGSTRHLTPEELISIIQQILVAGNETTSHTLTTGIYYLLTNPAEFDKLKADPSLIENFVEESLRMLTPTNNMWRVATEDTVIGGVEVKKNDLMLLRFGSANRDDAKFPHADTFDIERENAKEQLAFGAGVHLCLGQQLARKEMQKAFPMVLDRLKNLQLVDPPESFRYVPSILLRGVEKLELTFDPA